MFCPGCGSPLVDGQAFCSQCGEPVGGAARRSAGGAVNQPNSVAQGSGAKHDGNVITHAVNRAVKEVAGHVDNYYGATEQVDLKFSDFFSEVTKKHTHGEAEEIFIAGSAKTTPSIQEAARSWQKPWFYSRILLFMLIPYFICMIIWSLFQNSNVLPGMIVLGSFAVPFATAVFFFEANVEQNISFMDLLRDFLVGGTLSLLFVFPLLSIIPGSGVGEMVPALLTGFIEETAKALAVAVLFAQRKRPMSILNGLLIGAAVGAGFAAFESAGYAFGAFVSDGFIGGLNGFVQTQDLDAALSCIYSNGYDAMVQNIVLRGFLAIGGHVAWAALEGAGLAIANEGLKEFEWSALLNPKFLVLFVITIACHGYWDWTPFFASIPIPYAEWIMLIFIIWVFLLVFLRRGIAQVNQMACGDAPQIGAAK